jgi:DNA-3-methyladenine glycosylase I
VLAKQLKAQGYHFVGPTSVYAFMQNVGTVNDHVRGASERPAVN